MFFHNAISLNASGIVSSTDKKRRMDYPIGATRIMEGHLDRLLAPTSKSTPANILPLSCRSMLI
jgi:hypothetical protein